MVTERDVILEDGRIVHAYDTGPVAGESLALFWHHGSPQSGAPLDPLIAAATERSIRLLSYGRPSYGGSTPQPGRNIASAAGDVRQIAEAFGVGRFAVIGHSGGGPHALACGALLPGRVTSVVSLAGIAPMTDEFDWFDGMIDPGGLRAALAGRVKRARYAETDEFDPESFTPADHAILADTWLSLGDDAGRAGAAWPDGLIDDDVAGVSQWGFELSQVAVPVLLVQGGEDRVIPPAHAHYLLRHLPRAELWLRPRDGHISVLAAVPVAMDWLRANAAAS